MAEGDNRFRQLGTVSTPGGVDREVGGATVAAPNGVAKANPVDAPRLPEDGADHGGRSDFYAGTGQKDVLPEHQARRDAYPHIRVASS